MTTRTADRTDILLCVLLFLAAVAAVNPTLEMGVNDDWAFNHIAREFAATGHIVYNGWSAPMLVPQLIWAAPFVKFFGFSFLALRLSTVVLAAFLIPVLYALGRASGLKPPFASFATLLTVLSPLTMPEAVSFMSDVPALFWFALCLYCAVRSWKADTAKACTAWAILISVTGLLSGMNRQIYWVAPLSFLPAIAWVQRRSKSAMISLCAAWVSTFLAAVVSFRWYSAQPYALIEPWWSVLVHSNVRLLAFAELRLMARIALTVALILLPVLAGFIAPGRRAIALKTAVLVAALILAVSIPGMYWPRLQARWMGNVLTEYGVIPTGVISVGQPPVVLGEAPREAISMAVFLSSAACGLALWKLRKTERRNLRPRVRQHP